MDSHVENDLKKIQKWGENKMTEMPWNGFCMIPLISEFSEHIQKWGKKFKFEPK